MCYSFGWFDTYINRNVRSQLRVRNTLLCSFVKLPIWNVNIANHKARLHPPANSSSPPTSSSHTFPRNMFDLCGLTCHPPRANISIRLQREVVIAVTRRMIDDVLICHYVGQCMRDDLSRTLTLVRRLHYKYTITKSYISTVVYTFHLWGWGRWEKGNRCWKWFTGLCGERTNGPWLKGTRIPAWERPFCHKIGMGITRNPDHLGNFNETDIFLCPFRNITST